MALRSPYEFGYTLQSREHRLTTGSLADPVVDLVDDVLIVAVTRGASDVHWEPLAGGLSVRFRIDGQLSEYQFIAGDSAEKVIARLKILGGLDIAERRVPQDGKLLVHFVQQQATRPIDMRFASFPCLYGEKVVTRILDRAFNLLNADTLGLPVGIGLQVARILSVTHGFLLVCGPTGAGKTTTLYALLGQIDKQVKNIVTMEDPVEYELVGINQSQVNTKIGFSFETGLRSLLRQDPDVIMIGEIRNNAQDAQHPPEHDQHCDGAHNGARALHNPAPKPCLGIACQVFDLFEIDFNVFFQFFYLFGRFTLCRGITLGHFFGNEGQFVVIVGHICKSIAENMTICRA
jgi:type II secretory ATPase GspE/PulE/Tfp pilus assembly ATPase PilB-like protein